MQIFSADATIFRKKFNRPKKEISYHQKNLNAGMGADHSFYVKTIETHARAFLTLIILAIGSVYITLI